MLVSCAFLRGIRPWSETSCMYVCVSTYACVEKRTSVVCSCSITLRLLITPYVPHRLVSAFHSHAILHGCAYRLTLSSCSTLLSSIRRPQVVCVSRGSWTIISMIHHAPRSRRNMYSSERASERESERERVCVREREVQQWWRCQFQFSVCRMFYNSVNMSLH